MPNTKRAATVKHSSTEETVKLYHIIIFFLALASVFLAVLDLLRGLRPAELWIDRTIYGVFVVDYVVRFLIANNKQDFFKYNISAWIYIIPLNSALRVLLMFKMSKLFKFNKVLRLGA